MSETLLSLDGRPAPDCTLCRLGTLTVPCDAHDVRTTIIATDGQTVAAVRPYRTNVVQGEGPVPCLVMFIGEAPGFHEDREGRPFVPTAPAGRVLAAAMAEVGLYREGQIATSLREVITANMPWVYMANAVKCRPLDNKLDRFPDALSICRDTFLGAEIAAVQPRVIVCLGKVAAQPWFGSTSSLAFRQLPDGPLLIHAPHPSNIARGNAEGRPKLLEALRVAKEVGYGR